MQRPNASSLLLFGFSLGILTSTVVASSNGSSVYPDVKSGTYYDAAVGDMYATGIITGYANGNFGPDDYVTRGQVAVIIKRLRDQVLGIEPSDTSDSSSSSRSRASSSSSSSESSSSVTTEPSPDAGAFRFTTGSFKVEESRKTITVSVLRYGGTKGKATVDYETKADTAIAGTDFDTTSGTVSFNDGESTKNFTVTVTDDTEKEQTETIFLHLKNPTGGAILGSPATATLSVIDDDDSGSVGTVTNTKGIMVFSASEYQVAENTSQLTITVNRITGTQGAVAVNYATSDGTATSDNYTGASGTLNFADGETSKTFTVSIQNNSSITGNKTVKLTLSNATGGATFSGSPTSVITIIDDEITSSFGSGSIKLGDDSYIVVESDGTINVTIKRFNGTKGQATVEYTTQNGTAKSGTDYTETKGTLTFKDGESVKSIAIPITFDSDADNGEAFSFKLSNVVGATLDSPAIATIEIQ